MDLCLKQRIERNLNQVFFAMFGVAMAMQPSFAYAGPAANVLNYIRNFLVEFIDNDLWSYALFAYAFVKIVRWGLSMRMEELITASGAAIAGGLWILRVEVWSAVTGG